MAKEKQLTLRDIKSGVDAVENAGVEMSKDSHFRGEVTVDDMGPAHVTLCDCTMHVEGGVIPYPCKVPHVVKGDVWLTKKEKKEKV